VEIRWALVLPCRSAVRLVFSKRVNNMTLSMTEKRRVRKNFGQPFDNDAPDLLDIQLKSFESFVGVQNDFNSGINRAFSAVFPIVSPKSDVVLEFVSYRLEEPVFTCVECLKRARTYSSALYATFRVSQYAGDQMPIDIISEELYLGDIPRMTPTGSFVIHGVERVVISQIHKSPGVHFIDNAAKSEGNKTLPTGKIIPYVGIWLDLEFDSKDCIFFRLNKKKKMAISTLFYAMGYPQLDILSRYHNTFTVRRSDKRLSLKVSPALRNMVLDFPLLNDAGGVLVSANKRITDRILSSLGQAVRISDSALSWFTSKQNVGKLNAGTMLAAVPMSELPNNKAFDVIYVDYETPYIMNTYCADKIKNTQDALFAIYRSLKPGGAPTPDSAQRLFDNLFFNADKYDLSPIGRMKLNRRFGFPENFGSRTLTHDDLIKAVSVLIDIKRGKDSFDDIDNLSNRRIRGIGELLENQLRYALLGAERQINDKIAAKTALMPSALFASCSVTSSLRNFFNSSQLSQFMDQINPLSEVTHKRRISALGEGGISRERAGFEIRDVHVTHYGRLCPIETPEGGNIGLINSLSLYAEVDEFGFLQTPYKRVVNGDIQDRVEHLGAFSEEDLTIAQIDCAKDNKLKDGMLSCRVNHDVKLVDKYAVDLIDVSAQQTVSAAAALIPFLEHDDANRALMGSNMQRQAVPLMYAQAPLVGTGVERKIVLNSGVAQVARRAGVVAYADGRRVVVDTQQSGSDESAVDIYRINKYARSNQGTCINQRLLVKPGDVVTPGDVLADGCSTDMGELALGQNMLVAFMPWNGYNFEDSILISERVLQEDRFTSIHIEELICTARSIPTLGDEEITSDIPNVSSGSLSKLDECGIVPIGMSVKAGDILVGKVTPKQEVSLTPEEKLLHTLFGSKAASVKDSSLRLPANKEGVVVDVVIFDSASSTNKRSQDAISDALAEIKKDINDEFVTRRNSIYRQVFKLLNGKRISTAFGRHRAGSYLTLKHINAIRSSELFSLKLVDKDVQAKLDGFYQQLLALRDSAKEKMQKEKAKIDTRDSLPKSALKVVKVYVAVKRRIQPGDKLAGRHGNKGCISAIMPVEDMPFLEDGTPIDIVLNPLGVPSRMNVGQVLEMQLGLAARGLGACIDDILNANPQRIVSRLRKYLHKIYNDSMGEKVDLKAFTDDEILQLGKNLVDGVPMASPVFDGANEEELRRLLKLAGFEDSSGQFDLYDGRTGDKFERKVTVGSMYMLKLNHLVDEKMHARSTGPYSMVTQQPLGGKAQFGGQRLGEMEVWALQAYGAAYTLQEMLTIKSDDMAGRYDTYKNIVEGKNEFNVGRPESFNVLIQELKALGLNVVLQQ
jgi:DNA-directed RNA polymerase subunit beta